MSQFIDLPSEPIFKPIPINLFKFNFKPTFVDNFSVLSFSIQQTFEYKWHTYKKHYVVIYFYVVLPARVYFFLDRNPSDFSCATTTKMKLCWGLPRARFHCNAVHKLCSRKLPLIQYKRQPPLELSKE